MRMQKIVNPFTLPSNVKPAPIKPAWLGFEKRPFPKGGNWASMLLTLEYYII